MTKAIAGRSPGNDDEVSIIWFPHKLNIVLEGWKDGLRTRLEYYTPLKKGFILQSKGAHFENNSPPGGATRGEIILHSISSFSRGTAWPLHFKFASYAYVWVGI